jgi:hypothetical protein
MKYVFVIAAAVLLLAVTPAKAQPAPVNPPDPAAISVTGGPADPSAQWLADRPDAQRGRGRDRGRDRDPAGNWNRREPPPRREWHNGLWWLPAEWRRFLQMQAWRWNHEHRDRWNRNRRH